MASEPGIEAPFDWEALNRYTAQAPIAFTRGEDNEPWVVLPNTLPEPVLEDQTDFDL